MYARRNEAWVGLLEVTEVGGINPPHMEEEIDCGNHKFHSGFEQEIWHNNSQQNCA
jgi:hypothetical protein